MRLSVLWLTSNESITNDTSWRQTCLVFFSFLFHAIKENSEVIFEKLFWSETSFWAWFYSVQKCFQGNESTHLKSGRRPCHPAEHTSQTHSEVSPLNEWKAHLLLLHLL